MIKNFLAALVLSTCVAAVPAMAQVPKIGSVSPEIILRDSKFAQSASKKLNDEFAPRSVAIGKRIETFKQKAALLEREGPTLTESQRATRRKEVADLERDIQKEQRDFQADLDTQKRAGIQKVLDLINKVVLRIAKDENYDLILQHAIYASKTADLTPRIIAEMDKEKAQ
jgi:outer membrane protein